MSGDGGIPYSYATENIRHGTTFANPRPLVPIEAMAVEAVCGEPGEIAKDDRNVKRRLRKKTLPEIAQFAKMDSEVNQDSAIASNGAIPAHAIPSQAARSSKDVSQQEHEKLQMEHAKLQTKFETCIEVGICDDTALDSFGRRRNFTFWCSDSSQQGRGNG